LIARSDPAALWTWADKGHTVFAYADNHLIAKLTSGNALILAAADAVAV
jgi:hypothetical protein